MTEVAAQQNGSVLLPSETGDITAVMEKMELSNAQDTPPSTISHAPGSTEDLNLPLSAADGLIKKPFAMPLGSANPNLRPPLTSDQEKTYNTLLQRVSTWQTLPIASAKASPESPRNDT